MSPLKIQRSAASAWKGAQLDGEVTSSGCKRSETEPLVSREQAAHVTSTRGSSSTAPWRRGAADAYTSCVLAACHVALKRPRRSHSHGRIQLSWFIGVFSSFLFCHPSLLLRQVQAPAKLQIVFFSLNRIFVGQTERSIGGNHPRLSRIITLTQSDSPIFFPL